MNSTTKIAILLLITGIIVALIYWYYSKNKTIPYGESTPTEQPITEQPTDEITTGSVQEAAEALISADEYALTYHTLKGPSTWTKSRKMTITVKCYNQHDFIIDTTVHLTGSTNASCPVTVPAGETRTASFPITFSSNGTYTINVHSCSLQIIITDSVVDSAGNTIPTTLGGYFKVGSGVIEYRDPSGQKVSTTYISADEVYIVGGAGGQDQHFRKSDDNAYWYKYYVNRFNKLVPNCIPQEILNSVM